MEKLQQLRELYEAYIETTLELKRKASPLQGFLGFGQRLGTDACHGEFAVKVDAVIRESAASPAEAAAMLEYAIEVPQAHEKNELAYWMLLAVQGKMIPLTEHVTAEDAGRLLERYDTVQPKRLRTPVQKDLANALKKASK